MLERYTHYGWTKTLICKKWDIDLETLRSLEKIKIKVDKPRRVPLNAITQAEKQKVVEYALNHTEYNHREMAYRMIDANIAFMSPSSTYRILRENSLLRRRSVKIKPEKWNPHASLSGPDEVWQTDLMIIAFAKRDYYLLSYFDVFSRFVVYDEICLAMTGDSIKEASLRAIKETGRTPKVIQSDNGSCYISSEYRSFITNSGIDHKRIHPHCPNENAEIERYHRTVRELVDIEDVENFTELLELFKERIRYYNYERYHSSIGFVTPYDMYTGKAAEILESRKRKLKIAKEKRIQENLEQIKNENQNQSQPNAA